MTYGNQGILHKYYVLSWYPVLGFGDTKTKNVRPLSLTVKDVSLRSRDEYSTQMLYPGKLVVYKREITVQISPKKTEGKEYLEELAQ